MNKDIKILTEVFYWQKKLKIRNILLSVDNKTKYVGYVCDYKIGIPALFLNLKALKEDSDIEIISTIFHEFGHIKYKTYLWKPTEANKVKREYLAETYALKQLKKYFPKEYKNHIEAWKKQLQIKSWQKEFPIHYKAFSKIREYKEG